MNALPCHRRCCPAAPASFLITHGECRHVRCVGAGVSAVAAPPRLAVLARWKSHRCCVWAAMSAVRGRWRPARAAPPPTAWAACAACVGRPRRPAVSPGGRLVGADRAFMHRRPCQGARLTSQVPPKGPEEAVGVPRPTRRWPTAMLRAGGAAVARLTRCHGRQTADSNGYGPFWGLSDLLYMVVSMCECVFASCCVVLSSYRSVPDSLSAKNRVLRRFPRGLGPIQSSRLCGCL